MSFQYWRWWGDPPILVSFVGLMEYHLNKGAETPIRCATTHHEALNQNDSLSIEGGDTRLDVLRIQLDCSMAAQGNASKFFRLSSCHRERGKKLHNFV